MLTLRAVSDVPALRLEVRSRKHPFAKDLDYRVLDRGWKICKRLHFSTELLSLARDVPKAGLVRIEILQVDVLPSIQCPRCMCLTKISTAFWSPERRVQAVLDCVIRELCGRSSTCG